ncbi:MAG TPA: hypothetical protein VMV59_03675, partial [Candidatus Dormibacteraeota bacterium]|nr:hypothetical protein [Candidatus Dormibacteraeota bacterium]
MILPLVGELLSRVGRQQAVEECFDRLRRGAPAQNGQREVVLTGLTDPAKALLVALAVQSLSKQTILLVESNRKADDFEALTLYFLRALGRANAQVTVLPAHEVFPYDHQSPHPEISEARAAALWRLTSGEADLVIAPVTAAVLRLREPQYYRSLALALARGEDVPREELLAHLASVGYEAVETVEMPGQFAVRGGILDVFPPEAERPVRLELLGDTLESLREFDTDTQRSTSPVERITLLPLTDSPRSAEQLERLRAPVIAGHEDSERREPDVPAGFFPGWEFRAFLGDRRESNLLRLRENVLVIEDEPAALDAALEKYRARFAEAAAEEPEEAPPESYIVNDEEWRRAKEMVSRLGLEQLALGSSSESQ